MRAAIMILTLLLVGCVGASEGKRRSWNPGQGIGPVEMESCAADCAAGDKDRRVCREFHEWTSERCAELLSRELRR